MRRSLLLVLLIVPLLVSPAGCGGEEERSASPHPASTHTPEEPFGIGTVVIDSSEGSTLLTVEVADTAEQQQLGLMHRTELPEDRGMIFVFLEEHTGGFWMKNTLIPLSIAYFDAEGKILSILDMEPCEADPCPVYDPGVGYHGALEVNQGAFDEWGVEVGDTITLTRSET